MPGQGGAFCGAARRACCPAPPVAIRALQPPQNILRADPHGSGARRAGGHAAAGALLGAALFAGGGLRAQETMVAPSGLVVTFLDTVTHAPGPEGLTYRFRFLAPEIAGDVDFETVSADMLWLCETYALPRLATPGPAPSQVVISISDRPVDFGATDAAAVQFFEAYRPEGEACEWEIY